MRTVLLVAALACLISNARSQCPYVVEDIYPGPTGSQPFFDAAINGWLVFEAATPTEGRELWRTDGTKAGTSLIRDIYPGVSNGVDYEAVAVGDVLYFQGIDAPGGRELWRTDGSAAGTVMVRDIWPGQVGSGPHHLTAFDGQVFFSATQGGMGYELWKSDGTPSGTQLVVDVNPNGSAYPFELTVAVGRLYFVARNTNSSYALFRTDGTTQGTAQILDLTDSVLNQLELEEAGGQLFFARRLIGLQELWKVGGPEEAPVKVAEIGPWSLLTQARMLTGVGGKLFFNSDQDLWVSDGTQAGTARIHATSTTSIGVFTDLNGTLLFRAGAAGSGQELWRSDGTQAGTTLVKDINPGPGSSQVGLMGVIQDEVYFAADDGSSGSELWKSDGSAAGTFLVADLSPSGSSSPWGFTEHSGRLFFNALDPVAGPELWALGTSLGPTTYCTAGTSASGCQASISASGTASSTAGSGFTLAAAGVEGGKHGIFFFGANGRQANPWGNGGSYQCVAIPVARGGVLVGNGTTGLCDGALMQDLNALWCPACPQPQKGPGPGTLVQAQLWYRDPLNTSNRSTSLSDAIEFCVGP